MQKPKPRIAGWIVVLGAIAGVVVAALALFALIQVIPYGKNHTNPPVTGEPKWNSSETRALAKKACFDCHSNETAWPWYSSLAPLSWLIQRDVDEGRKHLNFSEWGVSGNSSADPPQDFKLDQLGPMVDEGEMPPGEYLILHPGARLSADETTRLVDGLTKSLVP